MNTYICKIGKKSKIGLMPLMLIIGFVLVSCERDEYLIAPPIKLEDGCDTSKISYSKTVSPLLSQCMPCHNNSDSYGGVNLEGYQNIKNNAMNGKLLGSLRGSMSSYFNKSDCDYLKIQAWINNSAPNN